MKKFERSEYGYNKPSLQKKIFCRPCKVKTLERFISRQTPAYQRQRGIPSRERNRCAETCSGRRSCKRTRACPRHASCPGTGTPAHQRGTFSDKYRRSDTASCADGVNRAWWWDCSWRRACRTRPPPDQRQRSSRFRLHHLR